MSAPAYQVEVDKVTSPDWADLLNSFSDASIYQSWSYGAVRWGARNLSHLVLRKGNAIVGAAQVRVIRPPLFRCGVAYVRWGPLCQLRGRELEFETGQRMMAAMHAEYVVKRGLSLKIVPSAFGGTERAALLQRAFAGLGKPNQSLANADRTLVLDLRPSLDELRKRLDQKWRNQLNRAEKNQLTIIEGTGGEQYQTFLALYNEMWSRKRFDTSVDPEEFGRICEDLPEPLKMKILLCHHQGAPVGGIVCSALGDTGIYLLGATTGNGLQSKAAYLLQWTFIKWLKENGFRYYDLGGIDPERNPGVYHFKSGLSGQDVMRIPPLEACGSGLSALCMKAADVAQKGIGSTLKELWKKPVPPVLDPAAATQSNKI